MDDTGSFSEPTIPFFYHLSTDASLLHSFPLLLPTYTFLLFTEEASALVPKPAGYHDYIMQQAKA